MAPPWAALGAWAASWALLAGAAQQEAQADQPLVLPPAQGVGGPTKMLVFVPGGAVPNDKYIATAKAIQQSASALNLWVVIPAVFQRLCIISCPAAAACAPLHHGVETALDVAKAQGWKRGMDSEDLWLAGHSLGGVCANTLFQAYSSGSSVPYAGVIVMGSYVDEAGDHDVTNFPAPVLTLNAELDGGLARPGKTAIWWHQYLGLVSARGEEYATTHKPVIVLPKLNHSDFCPGFNVPGDLMAEVSQDEATSTIGEVVAAFLELQSLPAAASSATSAASAAGSRAASALGLLREKVAWTRQLLTPYVEAQAMERDTSDQRASSEGASPFCARAQRVIAGLSAADDERLSVADGFHAASTGLEHCHPNWTLASGRMEARTCGHTDYYADFDNTGSISAASEIACKLLSSDRVAQQLNTSAERRGVDCRAANRLAAEIAESLAAPSTLERYRRRGRGWCFLEDQPVVGNIGPLWVFQSSLKLGDNGTCMAVASPVLKTEVDGPIFPGSHYCKLLSPARALDWMMTDSLKRKAGSEAHPAEELWV